MKTAIAEKTLWDDCGNSCRVDMYCIGQGVFEVYFHDFNQAIPRREVGSIGVLNAKVDLWLAAKKQAGFIEQLPSYCPSGEVRLSID